MATNLLELLKEHFSEDVVANFASLIGETPHNLQNSLNTALPALLTGLVEKGSDGLGSSSLFKVMMEGLHDGGILSNLGALSRGGEETTKLLDEGTQLLTSIFGDNKTDGISSLVAGAGGISKNSANSLLGFVTPIVLGLLGKSLKIENIESVAGLMDFLSDQGDFLKHFAPSGLDKLLPTGAAPVSPVVSESEVATPPATGAEPSEFDIAVSTLDEVSEPSPAKEEFSIADTFDKIDDAIEDFAQESMATAKNVMGDLSESVSEIGSGIVEDTKEFAGEAMSVAKEAAEDFSETAGKIGSGIVEESKDFAKNAADVFEEGTEGGRKFLPWILIAAALALIWGLLKSCGTSPEPENVTTAPVTVEPEVGAPSEPKAPPAAEPAAETPAITPAPASSEPVPSASKEPPAALPVNEPPAPAAHSDFFEKTLDTGFVIKAPKDGFESKLIGFIESSDSVKKDLWFNVDGIVFDTNRATIKAESMPQINLIVEVLKAYPKVKIKIGGYADNTGKPAINKKLSVNRAKTVKNIIVKAGIAEDRVIAEGYGSDHPLASNDTAEGRQMNRRIDVRVIEK